MTNQEALDAALAWIVATIPELDGSTYDHIPAGKSKALPDVVGDLGQEEIVREDPEFVLSQMQQVGLRLFRLGFSFMVESGTDEAGAEDATHKLRGYAEALIESLLNDATLGGRVQMASPFLMFDYTPPFVEYDDGTRGREATLTMTVGERLEVED